MAKLRTASLLWHPRPVHIAGQGDCWGRSLPQSGVCIAPIHGGSTVAPESRQHMGESTWVARDRAACVVRWRLAGAPVPESRQYMRGTSLRQKRDLHVRRSVGRFRAHRAAVDPIDAAQPMGLRFVEIARVQVLRVLSRTAGANFKKAPAVFFHFLRIPEEGRAQHWPSRRDFPSCQRPWINSATHHLKKMHLQGSVPAGRCGPRERIEEPRCDSRNRARAFGS